MIESGLRASFARYDVAYHYLAIPLQSVNCSAADLDCPGKVSIDVVLGYFRVGREDHKMRAIQDLALVPCRRKKSFPRFLIGDHDKLPRLQAVGRWRKNERALEHGPIFG